MRRSIITGIDIGTAFIRVVVVEIIQGVNTPQVLGIGISPSVGLRHGYISHFDDAVKSIQSAILMAEKRAGIKIKEVFVGLGGISLHSLVGTGSVIISRADGEVSDLDVKKVLYEAETKLKDPNKHIVYSLPIRFFLDDKEIFGRPHGLKGTKLNSETFFVLSHFQHINDAEKALESIGLDIIDIVPSPIAASMVTLSRQQKTAGVLLANIGSETVSLCIFENNVPISLSVLPVGSINITNDLALGLRITLDEAEKIKLGDTTHSFPTRKLSEIINARLSDIFELIDAHLRKIHRSGLLPAGIVLTGGGANLNNIDEHARTILKLPARIGIPIHRESEKEHQEDASWAVAYGLCLWAPEEKSVSQIQYWFNKGKRASGQWLKQFLP